MAEDRPPMQQDESQAFYDQETEVRFLVDIVRRLENKTVIDVGAEKGSITRALLGAGAEAIHAFEPFPANLDALREAFGADHRVRIFDLALGASDETRHLHVVEDKTHQIGDAYHTLVPFEETPTLRIVGEIPIHVRTLDSLVAEGQLPPHVGVLKIDTERSDLAVLQGMGRIRADVVMLEFWDTLPETVGPSPYAVSEVVALMAERGYSTYVLIKRFDQFESLQVNVAQTRPGDWGNLLFVHDASLPALGSLLFETVARAQTELVDKAIFFAGEAEKRMAVIEQDAASAREAEAARQKLTDDLRNMADDLQEKEYVIVELAGVADERLRLAEQATGDARLARADRDTLAETVREQERTMGELIATADERLRLVEQLDANSAQLRARCDGLAEELEERARVIDGLSEALGERSTVIDSLTHDVNERAEMIDRLTSELQERGRIIDDLAATAEERLKLLQQNAVRAAPSDLALGGLRTALAERDRLIQMLSSDAEVARQATARLNDELRTRERLISDLTSTAEERLRLVEAANAALADLRARADGLADELGHREQIIADLTTTAAERLELVDRVTADTNESHAAAESLTADLQSKEALIASLSATAEERLKLVDAAAADAAHARDEAARLRTMLGEQATVIAELKATADERLRLIERLNAEVARAHHP